MTNELGDGLRAPIFSIFLTSELICKILRIRGNLLVTTPDRGLMLDTKHICNSRLSCFLPILIFIVTQAGLRASYLHPLMP
jgi:hypothetical protein